MSMDDHDNLHDAPAKRGLHAKKTQNSFLALGIVFISVRIGMSFGVSSAWIVFFVLGVTFLAMSATGMAKERGTTSKRQGGD